MENQDMFSLDPKNSRKEPEEGLTASILSTINKRLGNLIGKINVIMNLAENPRMMGMRNSLCAWTLYDSEIVTSILNNIASWIGITDKIIDKLGDPERWQPFRLY